MGVVSQTEREENVESTIWINLAFKEFNCIIEMQGCAPETLIRNRWFHILGALPAWRCFRGICNRDNEESKLGTGSLTDKNQGNQSKSIWAGPPGSLRGWQATPLPI